LENNETYQYYQTTKAPAGRRLLAVVTDAESEAVQQGAFLDEGPGAVLRGNITKAVEYLSESRSPCVLVVDITDVAMPITEVPCLADVCARAHRP
jgi:hypothetical protein